MQQHTNASMQWSSGAWSQSKKPLLRRWFSCFVAIFLILATLACGFIETRSQSASDYVILTRLPTLTRTPLPTLTPTSNPASVAVVPTAESFEIAPTLASQPESTPVVPPVSAASSASGLANTSADVSTAPDISLVTEKAEIKDTPASSASLDPSTAPTTTPTSPPPVTPTETHVPTSTPAPTATETPLPTSTPTTTPTPLPEWVFSGVRISTDQYEDDLLLYGDVMNNTGSSQELAYITVTFYDAQSQVIADQGIYDYWPVETIPHGGQAPFEITVIGIQDAANYDLRVEAEPSEKTLHQEFEFLDLSQSDEDDTYCLGGRIRNDGNKLQSYLVIVAVLYDSQDNVVNFSDYYHYSPKDLVGDETLNFEICADTFNQEVARFELRPWGI